MVKTPENKIGFTVMYHQPDDKKKFDRRYQKHLDVFEESIGSFVQSAEVHKVDNEVFYQVAIVKLRSGTDFDALMSSPGMKTVVDDVLDFVPADKFQVFPITQTLYES